MRHQILKGFTLLSALFLFTVIACERPSSPDFSIEHSIDLPLIQNIEYIFLGSSGAIIDTTDSSFQDLFTLDNDGLVRIATEIDFDIGDFSDVVPEISTTPEAVESNVGLLEVSFEGRGNSDFEEVTGLDPSNQPAAGQTIFGGNSPPITTQLEVDDFDFGVIESGRLRVAFENDLGFDIQNVSARIFGPSGQIGDELVFQNVEHGDNVADFITFSDGDILEVPLDVIFDVSWTEQNMKAQPGDLVSRISDDNLTFREATAIIKSQDFSSSEFIEMDDDEVRFTSPSQYVEVASGSIVFQNMVNSIDLDFESLVISFPDILMPPYNASDSLVIRFEGNNRIQRSSIVPDVSIDLSNSRIFAFNNELNYNIVGFTEDTNEAPVNDRKRTVRDDEGFTASVEIQDLTIAFANAVFSPRLILLSEDDGDDGFLDLFNENEATITEIEDFETLSENISNLKFFAPELSLNFETNVQTDNFVYAAILGITEDGQETYLRPLQGSPFTVSPTDTIGGFLNKGNVVGAENLLRIPISPQHVNSDGVASGTVVFNNTNSNISEFISDLPTEIRFIGKNLLNPNETVGTVVTPVIFETNMSIDIPMSIGTDGVASYSDTLSTDLSALPGEGDDMQISEATLRLDYFNRLPMTVRLFLDFLDEEDNLITQVPLSQSGEQDIALRSGVIDPGTRFAIAATNDRLIISLNSDQLKDLAKTANIKLRGELETPFVDGSSEVRVRADDYFGFKLFGKFKLITTVD